MNIDKLFEDKKYLLNKINFFIRKSKIMLIKENKELVRSHIKKARHNLEFYKLNKNNNKFNDWLIVTLYYALYHSALALITNKNYSSKNHYATILLLIKEYSINEDEVNLLNELSINKDDAELYTKLKDDRHDANYETNILFNEQEIIIYEKKVLDFINKAEELID